MIFSAEQIFSDDQVITATAISENVIDLGVAQTPFDAAAALHQDIGKGVGVPILIQVTEDFAGLTSLEVTVESADDEALTTNAVVAYSSTAIPVADLVQGYMFSVNVLPDKITGRYLGVRYTVVGGPATGDSAITAGIVLSGRQTNVTGA